MSKAGRRARRERLIESGEWSPASALDAISVKPEDARTRALLAERDALFRAGGRDGWQREMNRRRAARIARHKQRRRTRERAL